jgi:hypothetical protein
MIDAMTRLCRLAAPGMLRRRDRRAMGRQTRMRGIYLAIGLAGLASLVASFAATAQDEANKSRATVITATPPMPPMRPSALSGPAATAFAPLVGAPPGKDPMVVYFADDMPQILPPASHAQMHKCTSEWQKMQASGAAVDKYWLGFAQTCLTQ